MTRSYAERARRLGTLRAMVRPLRLETALPMIAAFVAGCRPADSAPPLRPTEAPSCVGPSDALLAAVTLAPSKGHADYLELREETASGAGAPDGGSAPVVVARAGTPCAGATDKARCVTTLRGLRSKKGFSERSDNHMASSTVVTYLVASFGDRLEMATTKDELRALLAPIDTPADVELVAGCGRMLRTAAGWELTKVFKGPGDCWGWTSGWQRLAVSADGAVTPLEDHSVHHPPTCIGGRRPEGLLEGVGEELQGTLAEFFVASAHLEAASVVAFERLAVELTERGAPAELIARARQSRDDESRHAEVMEGFVRQRAPSPRTRPPTLRSRGTSPRGSSPASRKRSASSSTAPAPRRSTSSPSRWRASRAPRSPPARGSRMRRPPGSCSRRSRPRSLTPEPRSARRHGTSNFLPTLPSPGQSAGTVTALGSP